MHVMKKNIALFCALLNCLTYCTINLKISREHAAIIGNLIWKNESNQSIDKLTFWKDGEEFASFGIGHFIWYPEKEHQLFSQTFPGLLYFFKQQGIKLPQWLEKARKIGCPWRSRDEFMQQLSSKRMKELRDLLIKTIDLQTLFIIRRFEKSIPKILDSCNAIERHHIQNQINRLSSTLNGLYALVDYINFKGEGIDPKEAYNNHSWGLKTVLLCMQAKEPGMPAVEEFVQCAQKALETRIKFSPKERNESQWLAGWLNRIQTYKIPLSA